MFEVQNCLTELLDQRHLTNLDAIRSESVTVNLYFNYILQV